MTSLKYKKRTTSLKHDKNMTSLKRMTSLKHRTIDAGFWFHPPIQAAHVIYGCCFTIYLIENFEYITL